MNGELNNISVADDLIGVRLDLCQRSVERISRMMAKVCFNDLGFCYGCHEKGVAVKRGEKLDAHVPGCRVAEAMSMR